jgi:hypothetical protein
VYGYCVAVPSLYVQLRLAPVPATTFVKPALASPLLALAAVLACDPAMLVALSAATPHGTVAGVVPAPGTDERAVFRASSDRLIVVVNGRLVVVKAIARAVKAACASISVMLPLLVWLMPGSLPGSSHLYHMPHGHG